MKMVMLMSTEEEVLTVMELEMEMVMLLLIEKELWMVIEMEVDIVMLMLIETELPMVMEMEVEMSMMLIEWKVALLADIQMLTVVKKGLELWTSILME